MRIAFLGHKRIPSNEGGIEVVVEQLAVRMVERGCSVTCFNRAGHHISGAEFDTIAPDWYRGVRIETVPTLPRRGLAAVSASVSATVMAALGKFDVVHIHAEGAALMCWLPKLTGKHVIVTIHGLDYKREKWGKFASWYIRMGEKSAVRFADEIIVLSENVRAYFQSVYGRKTRFIPNGSSCVTPCEAEEIRRRFGLEKDSYLLFMGRIVPEKGLKELILAFKRIRTDKKMVIAGGSSDTDAFHLEMKKLAADDPRILLVGFVQGRIKEELYSNCYLYVLYSHLEGMPLSLLEAMSYGNCCVVSDIPECTEVVEDKAVLVPTGRPETLAEKLQWLCNTPDAVEERRKGVADYILRKYNWDDVADKTLSLYYSLYAPPPDNADAERISR